ncbi:MAG: hypothetical protein H5U18_02805 [Rhodobacteraceae bacterium]|nr:hypothetical protein [Paracoccaceae bacterium]
MSSETERQTMKATRASDFKFFPSDAISLGINDNGVKLYFGIEEADKEVTELVGVHMTHRTAVLLRNAIDTAISHFEEATGTKIQAPEGEFLLNK